jgi:methionyl-tRNA synthetase
MIVRYRDGVVPDHPGDGLDAAIEEALASVHTSLEELKLHEALATSMDLARAANGYVEEREPWAQAKDPSRGDDLDGTLATLARVLAVLTALFHPVCPARCAELARRLGLDGVPTLAEARGWRPAGASVVRGEPLFPRVDFPSE